MNDGTTIAAAFAAAVSAYGDKPFFAVPAGEGRGYLEAGFEISYGEAARQVEALAAIYRAAGYGLGHRVATLCHLANHSLRLGRSLQWDAKAETIRGDEEATKLLERAYRAPWDTELRRAMS
jgi:hypothetical protein